MYATHPAARAALTFTHFVFHDHEVLRAGLWLGAGDRPANPLVPRQRRDVVPHGQHFLISQDGLPHIVGQLVHRPASKFFRKHIFILANP